MDASLPYNEVDRLNLSRRSPLLDTPLGPVESLELLRAVTEGTAQSLGDGFFRELVRRLAEGLHMRWAFVAECLPALKARSLAFWVDGQWGEDFEYDLPGTPCMEVARGRTCHIPDRLPELFPEDKGMIEMGALSYLGVPLLDSQQRTIGHLVVFNDKLMPANSLVLRVVETFAARAGVELERKQADEEIRRRTEENAALLDVNRAIGRHLNRGKLFGALAACLGKVVPTDHFGIELPTAGDQLQGHILSLIPSQESPTLPSLLPAEGTACDWVIQHRESFIVASRRELQDRFPVTLRVMEQHQMESLCALPLVAGERVRGALFFMASRSGAYQKLRRSFLEQVASIVAVAVDDCLAHEELRQLRDELAARKIAELEQEQRRMSNQLEEASAALRASEERFRDLFDEAPIAYVHEDMESRFIRANRAALRILGIRAEEAVGTIGMSLIPDTPEAQRRVKEAFASIGRGTDTSGVVLELRRKDNGKPIWIQWWSRPDPSGAYTRTMFIDITERVEMEQEKARLEAQNTYLQEEIRSEHNFDEIIGKSPALLRLLRDVDQVARTHTTVLILGETGTGKELIARAIHDRSGRKGSPLVKVNCGAISAGLVESELFGHVKGAFTGALAHRDGRFKLADSGTIFLDEVGELPLDTQVKLLRVLQEQEFEPIGSSQSVKVDVRIIAATNRDLTTAVRQGRFREDLFYRLNVFPLRVPALRERREDIPLLVSFFVQRFAKKFGKTVPLVSSDALLRVTQYEWPGNIRELQNVIERAVVLCHGGALKIAGDFPAPALTVTQDRTATPSGGTPATTPPPPAAPTSTRSGSSTLEDVERRHIESVLQKTNWMIEGERGAARILNLNPSTLRSRMQKLGIKRPR